MNTFSFQERPSIMSITNRILSLRADLLRFRIDTDFGQQPTKADVKLRQKELVNLRQWVSKEQIFPYMSSHEQQRHLKPLSKLSGQDLTDASTTSEALGTLLWATGILDSSQPCDQQYSLNDPIAKFPFMASKETLIGHVGARSFFEIARIRDLTVLYFAQLVRAQLYRSKDIDLITYLECVSEFIEKVQSLGGKIVVVDNDLWFNDKPMSCVKGDEVNLFGRVLTSRLICLSWVLGEYHDWDHPLFGQNETPNWLYPFFE